MKPSWRQLNVRFDEWDTVEHTAVTRLGPAIAEAEAAGLIDAWFFMRKAEKPSASPESARPLPCWRVRILPRDETTADDALAVLRRHLPSAVPVVYEPEVHAFGGDAAMALAHALFHQDSRHILTYLSGLEAERPVVGRRELAMLLCSRLFRAAGQDWYEQGDIWDRIAHNRLPDHELPPDQLRSLQPAIRRLMTVDTTHLACDPSNELAFAADWLSAFDTTGAQLAQLARDGGLQRGLRGVLAHHALFAFNRLGLLSQSQTLLAHAASTLIFD